MITIHHSCDLVRMEPRLCGTITGCIAKGRNTSGDDCGVSAPVKPGGFTTTSVTGVQFREMDLPTTDGERPKRRSQYPSLITTTAPLPIAASSGGSIGRPSCGTTPSS